MIRNYIKIAWRNLKRNKAFSFINLLGLTIGMVSTIFILLWIQYEFSWNKSQKNYNTTSQVFANRNFNGEIITDGSIMLPFADAIEREIPQVEAASFTSYPGDHVLQTGDKKIKKSGIEVSAHYFDIFSWKFLKGSASTALVNPDAIILTHSSAKAFFGDRDPINQVLRMDNQHDMKVVGVVEDIPNASTIQFDFITRFNVDPAAMNDWQNSFNNLFLKTKPNADIAAIEKQMNAIALRHDPKSISTYFTHPMSKWRLYSDFSNGINSGGMIEYVRLFSIIALVILVIACVNFMNLSTARSEKRAKEVGIRKTLGSGKKDLVMQFFFESVILALIAFLLSITLVYITLPVFNSLLDKQLRLNFAGAEFWIASLLIILVTGVLAGSYPAVYLSSFNPVKVLKGSFLPGKKALLPRRILVVGQFIISILLISATIIVYQQIQHVKARDIGYNPSNLISIPLSNEARQHFSSINTQLMQSGLVESVTGSSAPLTDIWNYTPAPDYEGKPEGDEMIVSAVLITENFTSTAGIPILQGRDFSGTPADSSSIMLNEAAIKTMGLKNPVGMKMRYMNREYTVTGVTGNVVMASPYKPVDPMMMLYRPERANFATVRLKKSVKPQDALSAIGAVFATHSPETPFEYRFTDQEFNRKFITEELIGRLINIFAGLAIFICCLGISGLAAFTVQKRLREIGIRKVLGASVRELLYLVSKEFLRLVFIALLIAIPLAWWGLHEWLQQYAYRIDISIWQFAIAGAGVLCLTLITVSANAIRAAIMKPVQSLRTE